MRYLFIFIYILIFSNLNAQISYVNYPLDSKIESVFENINSLQIDRPNIESLIEEDKITDNYKDISWRFGAIVEQEIDVLNQASKVSLASGDLVYRLKISTKDAMSLNFNYSQFELAEGVSYFIHADNLEHTIGGFNEKNNPNRIDFASGLTKGKSAIIEVFVPLEAIGKSKITISSIVYGYRSLYDKAASYGQSAYCNVNINCSLGDNWQSEKRSVVIILSSSNSRLCTGTLINNVRQDSTPYVLSAQHCPISPSNSIYIFNYESANCHPQTDGYLNKSIVGSTVRANYIGTDFVLFELSSKPPLSYNVFYAGWNADGTAPTNGTGIHHPAGDVKKISVDYDTLRSSRYANYTLPNGHWEVSDWDIGSTQPGSSGSPIFNEKHQVVGQLSGGQALCGKDLPDFYGKFSLSWNHQSATNQQLKYWLDPDSTNVLELNGFDPNPSAYSLDLEMLSFNQATKVSCGNSLSNFEFIVSNRGNSTIDSITFAYTINNQLIQSFKYYGTIHRNEYRIIALPSFPVLQKLNELKIFVQTINANADQNKKNDTLKTKIYGFVPIETVSVELKTDNYGNEVFWQILDSSGNNILYESRQYPNVNSGQSYIQDLCLSESCYQLKLIDNGSDGYCCAYGNGYTLITANNGQDTLVFDNSFSGTIKTIPFCVPNYTSISENKISNSINVFPNPTEGTLNISIDNNQKINAISMVDLLGRYQDFDQLDSYNKISIKNLKNGIYYLIIETENKIITKKVVKF